MCKGREIASGDLGVSQGSVKLEEIKGGKTEHVNPRLEMQENRTGCSSGSKHPSLQSLCSSFPSFPLNSC